MPTPAMFSDAPACILLLTPRDVAGRLRLGVGTLAKWRLAGRGPQFRRVGSVIRYDAEALEAWIAAQPLHRATAEYTPKPKPAEGGAS